MATEATRREQAVQAILRVWEDTPVQMRLTLPQMREAASDAIDALRRMGWARS